MLYSYKGNDAIFKSKIDGFKKRVDALISQPIPLHSKVKKLRIEIDRAEITAFEKAEKIKKEAARKKAEELRRWVVERDLKRKEEEGNEKSIVTGFLTFIGTALMFGK